MKTIAEAIGPCLVVNAVPGYTAGHHASAIEYPSGWEARKALAQLAELIAAQMPERAREVSAVSSPAVWAARLPNGYLLVLQSIERNARLFVSTYETLQRDLRAALQHTKDALPC